MQRRTLLSASPALLLAGCVSKPTLVQEVQIAQVLIDVIQVGQVLTTLLPLAGVPAPLVTAAEGLEELAEQAAKQWLVTHQTTDAAEVMSAVSTIYAMLPTVNPTVIAQVQAMSKQLATDAQVLALGQLLASQLGFVKSQLSSKLANH